MENNNHKNKSYHFLSHFPIYLCVHVHHLFDSSILLSEEDKQVHWLLFTDKKWKAENSWVSSHSRTPNLGVIDIWGLFSFSNGEQMLVGSRGISFVLVFIFVLILASTLMLASILVRVSVLVLHGDTWWVQLTARNSRAFISCLLFFIKTGDYLGQ